MRYKGFSLIEVLAATMLIGLAIVSLLVASRSYTDVNGSAAEMSTAEFLTEQIRELTTMLDVIDAQSGTDYFGAEESNVADYDDVDDFDGANFSPPIAIDRAPLSVFSAYSQSITVENVNASDFEEVVADHASNFVRISVKIYLNSKEISSASWLRARY